MRSGTAAGRMAKSRDAGRRANYANEAPSPRFGVDKVNKSGRVDAITSLYRVFFSFFFTEFLVRSTTDATSVLFDRVSKGFLFLSGFIADTVVVILYRQDEVFVDKNKMSKLGFKMSTKISTSRRDWAFVDTANSSSQSGNEIGSRRSRVPAHLATIDVQ